jgi:ribosomal-protein-alanine N-acetyltransferase
MAGDPAATLRETALADAALLAALHADAMDAGWSAETFAGLLALPGTFGMLARVGDDPAGFVLARATADEAEILALVVAAAFRRRRIASALLAAAAAAARRHGALRLFLEVSAENAPARALYRAHGFDEVGRRKGYYARPGAAAVDALILSARLEAARA